MQGPNFTDPDGNSPQESDEILKLQSEYARLQEKRAQTTDPDIASVIDMRLKDLEASIAAIPDASEEAPPEESDEVKKLRAELERLKDKRSKTKDHHVIAVLEMRIGQIEPFLPPPPRPRPAPGAKKAEDAPPEEDYSNIPQPTAEESEQAEKFVRQAMLEKRRGNVVGATDLMKKAAAAAPGSPVVLEALGDDLLERKLTKQARETYKRALQLDPKNVGLERKFAQTVLQTTSTMSVEDQLRYGMSDSLFLTGNDNVAGLTAAKFLSAIVPGLGQMVIGRTTKGAVILGIWAACLGLLALWNKDFEMLAKFARGAGPSPNWRVLFPIIGMGAAWLTALADLLSGQSKTVARQTKVERPKPPVDLPFD